MINYMDDIQYICSLPLPWEKTENKTFLISGASGMIGSFLIHALFQKSPDIRVIALGRDRERARERFGAYWDSGRFSFYAQDINERLHIDEQADYVIHAASNTHPAAYAGDPIGTILTSITGTKHMLDLAAKMKAERFLFLSSVEIYGENRGDTEYFSEDYCGYIDCNTLRAGYPEGKRAGEALCQAYRRQKHVDAVIGRLPRVYGPSMLWSDTKAISQFIKKGAKREDIVLKSRGEQLYSYCYAADAAAALLTILLKGADGEAYNISDRDSDITLRELAQLIAGLAGVSVRFELPDEAEQAGDSKATKALLSSDKIRALGWSAHWDIRRGVAETIDYLARALESDGGLAGESVKGGSLVRAAGKGQ